MSKSKNGGAACIQNGFIVIRVPIDALQHIIDGATALNGLDQRWLITDKEKFAKEIVREINSEDEQGTTPFHSMFDKAMEQAIENGAEGVEEHPEQEF